MNGWALAGTVALGLALVGLLGPGAGESSTATDEPNPAPREFVVTRDNPDAPPCRRPRHLGLLMMRFNRALNAADGERLREFWREERKGLTNDRRSHSRGTFKWFSLTNSPSPGHKDHFVGFSPGRAVRYVKERRGFRLQLTEARGGLYQGLWILDDGRVFQVVGKGDFTCRHEPPLIDVWSMAVRNAGDELSWDLCPDPPGGAPPGALIVCAPERR